MRSSTLMKVLYKAPTSDEGAGSKQKQNTGIQSTKTTPDKYHSCGFQQRKSLFHYQPGQDNLTHIPPLPQQTKCLAGPIGPELESKEQVLDWQRLLSQVREGLRRIPEDGASDYVPGPVLLQHGRDWEVFLVHQEQGPQSTGDQSLLQVCDIRNNNFTNRDYTRTYIKELALHLCRLDF